MSDPSRPKRFARQFALTGGRARSVGVNLPLDALVQTTPSGIAAQPALAGDLAAIVAMCRNVISIAEISAHLRVHLGITRVLVSDLAAHGHVGVAAAEHSEDGPDLVTLERLLDDLHAL